MAQYTISSKTKVAPTRVQRIKNGIEAIAREKPAQLTLMIFFIIIIFVTFLLCLPISTANGDFPKFIDALFTATSAVCVTGLSTVDVANQWSGFGHAVIMVGIKIGGLGFMTLASFLVLAISKSIGLTQKIIIADASQTEKLGEIKRLIKAVMLISAVCELVIFSILLPHLYYSGKYSFAKSVWYSMFTSISTFNNAGFLIFPEGSDFFVKDALSVVIFGLGIFLGSIGFPVMLNVLSNIKSPKNWSLHSKLTLISHFVLLFLGMLSIGVLEWINPHTIAKMSFGSKLANIFLFSAGPRSGGISVIDSDQMHQSSLLIQDILMFIGGGSASTAGGIKLTTVALMILAIVAEARGDSQIQAFGRHIPTTVLRLGVAVTITSIAIVLSATMVILAVTDLRLDSVLFECLSAFGNVGLSMGITSNLPLLAKCVLIILMFVGRVGPITLTVALAMRQQRQVIKYPAEKIAVG